MTPVIPCSKSKTAQWAKITGAIMEVHGEYQ